jgi:PAS domain-containing protein
VIRFANPAAITALGYDSADELFGRRSHETIHHSRPDGSPYPAAHCPMLLPPEGHGLQGIGDRVAALGGRLRIDSSPGAHRGRAPNARREPNMPGCEVGPRTAPRVIALAENLPAHPLADDYGSLGSPTWT